MKHLRNEASRGVLSLLVGRMQQTARLMCGLPDYNAYVKHLRTVHPGQAVPSYEMFFRNRQEARYGRGMARCC